MPGRWVDQSLPQTLQGAVLFSYLNAALALVSTLLFGQSPFLFVFILLAVAAFGIANHRHLAYWAAVVLACGYLLGVLALMATGGGLGGVLNLLFSGVLVALLLHPESRHYQRIWFK
ncbi:MAG: hypothetical protein M0Z46_02770 [Actinomycetota bacterium]|jgi:hypothetical protein|nr:hypothetical protein [Actinomycetota bacterium]